MPTNARLTWTNPSGVVRPLDVDTQTNSLIVTTNEHHHIHEGLAWNITGTATLDAEAVYRYTFTTENSDYLTHFRFFVYGEAEGTATLFEAPTVSVAGTTVEPMCRNRDNVHAARTIVYHTPTTTGNGTQIFYGVFGANRVSGSLESNEEWIFARNTTYMLVITSDVAANEISWEVFFYEHAYNEDSYA